MSITYSAGLMRNAKDRSETTAIKVRRMSVGSQHTSDEVALHVRDE